NAFEHESQRYRQLFGYARRDRKSNPAAAPSREGDSRSGQHRQAHRSFARAIRGALIYRKSFGGALVILRECRALTNENTSSNWSAPRGRCRPCERRSITAPMRSTLAFAAKAMRAISPD